jgi:hypothetical protein
MNKKIKSIFFLVLFLFITISTLLILTNIITSTENSKTIILNNDLFEKNFSQGNDQDNLHVDNINTISLDRSFSYYNWIDDTHILILQKPNISDNPIGSKILNLNNSLAILNLTNSSITPLNNSILLGSPCSISPDGKKILYTEFNKESYSSKVYDISSGKISSEIINSTSQCWLPDSSGFIVVNKTGDLQLYDIEKDTLTTIVNINNYHISYQNCLINISRDASTLFLSNRSRYGEYMNSQKNVLYCVDISKQNNPIKKISLPLNNVYQYQILNKNTLIFSGVSNNKEGLYSYNINSDSAVCLVEGQISIFNLSPQGSDIAYIIDGTFNSNLYTGKIINNNLTSISMLYTGILDYKSIYWNRTGKKLMFTDWSPENINKLHVINFK